MLDLTLVRALDRVSQRLQDQPVVLAHLKRNQGYYLSYAELRSRYLRAKIHAEQAERNLHRGHPKREYPMPERKKRLEQAQAYAESLKQELLTKYGA